MNMLLYEILEFTIHGKNIKRSYKNKALKTSVPTWNEEFNYLMDHILYQIFQMIFNLS